MDFLTEIAAALPAYSHRIVAENEGGADICNWRLEWFDAQVEVYRDLNLGYLALFETAVGVVVPPSGAAAFGSGHVVDFSGESVVVFRRIS